MNTCNAEHQQLVAKLQAAADQLSPSERRVVDTLHARLAGGWPLTHHQAARLAELWDRITERN